METSGLKPKSVEEYNDRARNIVRKIRENSLKWSAIKDRGTEILSKFINTKMEAL